jgi:hypothetical protein
VEVRRRQVTSQEVRDNLLEFIRQKFYPDPGHWLAFEKDRPRLLQWVVLWPARWLDDRGVSLPAERFQELVVGALMEGLRHGATGEIRYLPAWLGRVVQSHFTVREDAIYAEAKAVSLALSGVMSGLAAVSAASRAPDPVREMAVAAGLLKARTKARAERKPEQDGAQIALL